MRKKKLSIYAASVLAFAFASCSSDGDNTIENNGSEAVAFNVVKAPNTRCTSNDVELGQYSGWYYKVQDYENTTTEHMPAEYAHFHSYAPAKGNNEAVTTEEKEYVISYLAEHPNEGSTEFNHYNYFIQYVGGSYDTYYTKDWNNADHSMVGSQQIDYIEFVDQNGVSKHINDYNAGGGPRALVLNLKITAAKYHDSYGNNTYADHYRFYTINYNGKDNLYLCFDYATHKDSGNEDLKGDGKYNDYVIKIIPGCGDNTPVDPDDKGGEEKKDSTETPDVPVTPVDPVTPTPAVTTKGHVEVNLAAQDHQDASDAKLSIHVRDTCNFEVYIPVEAKYSCPVDDMFIVEKHYGDMTYNANSETTVTRVINDQTVKLNIKYTATGIYVTSEGINNKVLEYCRNVFGDGLSFEVYTYFNASLTRESLLALLNQSTIKFTDNQPKEYINTIVDSNRDAEGRLLDCIVTKE